MEETMHKNFTVSEILVYVDEPIVFISKDQVDTRYICTFVSDTERGKEYICTQISYKKLNEFKSGVIDLRSMYNNPEIQEFYKFVLVSDEETFVQQIEDVPGDWLPEEGYFIGEPTSGEPTSREPTSRQPTSRERKSI
jgi:hypothetical protein